MMTASDRRSWPVRRVLVTAALLLALPFFAWTSGRAGLASLRTDRAARTYSIADADTAIRLSPNDPDPHSIRGALFEADNNLPAAIDEYQKAVSLRPDYVLWLMLARASELNGFRDAAIVAARRAVPLAPFYAQPHWQLGNLLIRAGQRDEGFSELRLAGRSNPTLLPAIIDLAGGFSGGNQQFIKQLIQPENSESFLALADYFKRHAAVAEAIESLRAAGSAGEPARRQYVTELIAAKDFKNAYALWLIEHPGNVPGTLIDPGFEHEQALDEPGFNWRSDNKNQSVSLSLDSDNPQAGRSALKVDFNGASDPGVAVISQIVLVEPKTHYQLRFACRTEALVTGGPPNVLVLDATDNHVLGQSGALPQTSGGWLDRTIDFVSGDTATAVQLSVQRDRCAATSCPIFGHLWLDSFSLQKQ